MKARGWEKRIVLRDDETLVSRGTISGDAFIEICFKQRSHWRVYQEFPTFGWPTPCNCPAMRSPIVGQEG